MRALSCVRLLGVRLQTDPLPCASFVLPLVRGVCSLLAEAERRSRAHGCRRVAVIAGVGSRGYYRKQGYELDPRPGGFMIKELPYFAAGWRTAALRESARFFFAGLLLAAALALGWLASACEARDGASCLAALLLP